MGVAGIGEDLFEDVPRLLKALRLNECEGLLVKSHSPVFAIGQLYRPTEDLYRLVVTTQGRQRLAGHVG